MNGKILRLGTSGISEKFASHQSLNPQPSLVAWVYSGFLLDPIHL